MQLLGCGPSRGSRPIPKLLTRTLTTTVSAERGDDAAQLGCVRLKDASMDYGRAFP